MLVSPTEPKRLRELGTVSSEPERHGADFIIVGKRNRIGVQRKEFPSDLLASLTDDRLYGQLPLLRDLEHAVLIIEGRGRWTEDGELIASKYQRFTRQQFNGLLFTIMFEFGVPSLIVKDMDETAEVLTLLDAWAQKSKHMSLRSRSGPAKNSFGTSTKAHLAQHILQGFPGVGPELAGRMVAHFEGVPLTWTHSIDELMGVEGLGKVKAQAMYDALGTVEAK